MNKIDFDLYQVKPKNRSNVMFCSLSLLKRLNLAVERANYEKVYSGTVETETSTGRRKSTAEVLESLYQRFNFCHPADYRARSMSVSDVVVLHENGRETAHFCDDIASWTCRSSFSRHQWSIWKPEVFLWMVTSVPGTPLQHP